MKIGIIGLGKLGLPVAVAIALKGHEVLGYDYNPEASSYPFQPEEAGPDGKGDFNEYFEKVRDKTFRQVDHLDILLEQCEIIFVAVQTPNDPQFEGVTRLPQERQDFDYSHLSKSIKEIHTSAIRTSIKGNRIIAVISTVLPGAMERHVKLWLDDFEGLKFVYNPFFIAMGTVMRDFYNPEFVLIGVDDEEAAKTLSAFYATVLRDPKTTAYCVSVAEAELIKVAYNVFIGTKITFSNTIMEICERMGSHYKRVLGRSALDADKVMNGLKLATERLISPAYLTPGMGDGGNCHPRDSIALSWLARKLNLSYDPFDSVMKCREKQAEFLCQMVVQNSCRRKLPILILGTAFKAGTKIEVGSSAVLCRNILQEWGHEVHEWDPRVERFSRVACPTEDAAYVILVGCNHPELDDLKYHKESVIVDPWGLLSPKMVFDQFRVGRTNWGIDE